MNLKFTLLFIYIFIHDIHGWKKDQLDLIFDIMDWVAINGKQLIEQPNRMENALGLKMDKPFHHVIAEAIIMEIPPSGHESAQNEIDQKIQFHYAFLVDCVLALNLNKGKNEVNYQQIKYLLSLQNIENHDISSDIFHGNDCGDVKTKNVFAHVLGKTPFKTHNHKNVVNYFSNVLSKEFVNEVKNQIEEGKLDWKNDKTEGEYFPKKLPKIFNLTTLVNLLANILKNVFPHDVPQLREIFDATVENLTINVDLQMHLLRKENSHYKELIQMVKEKELRSKITNLTSSESMFAKIFFKDQHYSKLYSHLNIKMMQFLAMKFGINPAEEPKSDANDLVLVMYNNKLQKQIAGKILESVETNEKHGMKKNEEMLNLLNHRLFCVGFRELINGPPALTTTKFKKLEPLLTNLEKIKTRMDSTVGHPFVKEQLMEIFEEVCKF